MREVTRRSPFAANELNVNMDDEALWSIFDTAYAAKLPYTNIFSGQRITADPEVKGFEEKVVLLTGPFCVSACDMTVGLFKTSGRATIVGEPNNGTGAGFISGNETEETWSDSSQFFKLQIPNYLFGVMDVAQADPNIGVPFQENWDVMMMENKTFAPDVAYTLTLDEILGKEQGWYKKSLEVLGLLPTPVGPPAPAEEPDAK